MSTDEINRSGRSKVARFLWKRFAAVAAMANAPSRQATPIVSQQNLSMSDTIKRC